MKPCLLFAFSLSSFFLTEIIFPQDSINHKQDSVIINIADDSVRNRLDVMTGKYNETRFVQEKKSKDALFFSLASGYAKITSDEKYNAIWQQEFSGGVIFNNHWIIGFKYEFWFSKYKGNVSPGVYTDVEFNGNGINIIGGYTGFFLKNKISISGGLGFGRFILDNGDYMSIIVFTGISYFPADYISLDLTGSAKLISPGGFSPGGGGAKGLIMPGIKIGASYYIYF